MHSPVEQIFADGGRLKEIPGYEHRPQQLEMAGAIADALKRRTHLVVEAPTGVGKSLAYLIPAVLYAKEEGRKAIVSTHTKNLQEQLLSNDMPIVRSVLGLPFRAVLFKGRRNYLCTTRLQSALRQQKRLFDTGEYDQLGRIAEWGEQTTEGDLDTIPFTLHHTVRQRVASERGACSPSICEPTCFYQQARIRAAHADLVIMNHALFFTLFSLKDDEDALVFENDFVIFDEAHTLEQVAGSGVGRTLSRAQVLFALHRLYNPATKKGLLARPRLKEYRDGTARAVQAAEIFFDALAGVVRSAGGRSQTLRMRAPFPVADTVTGELLSVERGLDKLAGLDAMKKEKDEVTAAKRLVWEAGVLIREFLELADPEATYWLEAGSARSSNVMLRSAPSSVADSIGKRLFREGTSVIMTSGTLSVDGSLRYFQERMGASPAGTLILDSPFDYRRQMRIQLVDGISSPQDPGYDQEIPDQVFRAVMQTGGKALVLFTNSRLMNETAAVLDERLATEGLKLLVQDSAGNRHRLLEEFRKDVSSVLFGLDSFWMGVDVPGEALEHVIVTRLPFSVPDHPLLEARMELIERSGGNPFMQYTLPEAILKFRQGVGRLIRSTTDQGIVTILDSRILRKRYGAMFLRSLPPCRIEILREDGSVSELEEDQLRVSL